MINTNQDLNVFLGVTQAQASIICPIASHHFAFNPDEVKWNISNNTVSRDTIGGRIVQLLSARVEQMTVVGRAGSRGELQELSKNLKKIIEYQIKSQAPVFLKVPSRKWNFKCYIQNVSSLGWDYAATSYPYELTLLIQEDLTGLTNKGGVEKQALERLAEGIGYVDKYHGGNAEQALAISEGYLNAAGYLRNFNKGSDISSPITPTLDVTNVGTGKLPVYGRPPAYLPGGAYFWQNIPEETFRLRTGKLPQFVFDRPYLYKWSKNGQTEVRFQLDAMNSFIKVVSDSGQPWIGVNGPLATFRTYQEQIDTKNRQGDLAADPGTSLHELGIAIDVAEAYRTLPSTINAFSANTWGRFAPTRENWHWSYQIVG